MTTEIKELVKRLRAVRCGPVHVEAADALEAMAGEVAGLKQSLIIMSDKRCDAVAERDRLKAALERVQFMSQTAHNERLAAINATATAALGGDAS